MVVMKILITDPVPERLVIELSSEGYKVEYKPNITYDQLQEEILDTEVLVVRGRLKIDKPLLEKANNLKKIIRFGVGLDNIDVVYAKNHGIKVYNIPGAFVEAVAELTLALILGILRGVGEAHYSMKSGHWIKKKLIGKELYGKTVGIIGFGRIGRRLYELLKPFSVNVLVYSSSKIPKKYIDEGVVQVDSLYEIAENCDIISIHVPLTKETRGMLNEEFFAKCKDNVFVINTSRGEVIDKRALFKFIKSGKIGGIALDVYWEEPFQDKDFLSLSNVLFTPHIGAQTEEAREKAVDEVIKIIKEG